jgi:predicted nucleotidyltransferase
MNRNPGTARHRNALLAIAQHYRDDSRVLAVVLFGSLARGDWDEYS